MNTLLHRFKARYRLARESLFLARQSISRHGSGNKPIRDSGIEVNVHLGHHFWGAGNLGDDFMLAGFLIALKKTGLVVNLTCCVPFNHDALRKRFPEIEWLEYTIQSRWSCIASADSWLGLGGTPFQNDCGDWLERHLDMDRMMCKMLKKPMYMLGTGVGNKAALSNPKYQKLIDAVQCIWARDEMTAHLLAQQCKDKVLPGADMANLFFARHTVRFCPKMIGYLIHFEDKQAFASLDLEHLTGLLKEYSHIWMVQESRCLLYSEKTLWQELPQQIKSCMTLAEPGPAESDLVSVLHAWKMPEVLLSARYHGSLLAAWSGSKVTILARNDKLRGLAQQLNLPCIEVQEAVRLTDAEIQATGASTPERLKELVRLAEDSVQQWAERARSISLRSAQARDLECDVRQGLGDVLG